MGFLEDYPIAIAVAGVDAVAQLGQQPTEGLGRTVAQNTSMT
ncbi:hypothetical protein EVA_05613, partial [gut metagenome]